MKFNVKLKDGGFAKWDSDSTDVINNLEINNSMIFGTIKLEMMKQHEDLHIEFSGKMKIIENAKSGCKILMGTDFFEFFKELETTDSSEVCCRAFDRKLTSKLSNGDEITTTWESVDSGAVMGLKITNSENTKTTTGNNLIPSLEDESFFVGTLSVKVPMYQQEIYKVLRHIVKIEEGELI